MAVKKYVYLFKDAYGLGKELLGGKGAGLVEMTHIGVPIPEGFTITTEACTLYYDSGKKIPDFLVKDIFAHVKMVEKQTGKKFGGDKKPLLVSVRSGARVSMPGMMDTILNLGLNDQTVVALAKDTGNERFAYDSYRRFILMFTNIAKGHPRTEMDKMLDDIKVKNGYKLDTEVTTEQLKELVLKYKAYYKDVFKEDFPTDPYVQLIEAVGAVFRSWDNPRANVYRQMNGIPYEWGTAVNVQSMAFGNMGEDSGTGVAFSRNPSTGEKKVYAEFLPNAQGEDVVAGIRTPLKIDDFKRLQPVAYAQFEKTIKLMEKHYKDMQDMEFTVEKGKLYFLQTRNGKRTARAALKIACDLVDEGLIDEKEACLRIEPKQLNDLLHPTFDPADLKKHTPVAIGLPASPGAGTGHLVFTAEEAKAEKDAGRKVVLARAETSPEDIIGMVNAEAIITARGGMTSHAAVVARSMGKCCAAGCGDAVIDEEKKTMTIKGKVYTEKDIVSVDGNTGSIYEGAINMVEAGTSGDFGRLMGWADKYRRLKVRVNANTPTDAEVGAKYGAEGIGLCRTERMFFGTDRILHMRAMILSDNTEQRVAALEKLRPYQVDDFYHMYMTNPGKLVCIRLLDPPLHEFLPDLGDEENIANISKDLNIPVEKVKERIGQLKQANPMMGFRGCRLCVAYPEIYRMQATAIVQAAIKAQKDLKKPVEMEIMIPLTEELREFHYVKGIVVEAVEGEMKAAGVKMKYHVGTMIEVPRGALMAGEIAKEAEFFSYGTNDLTQLTMGFSRDDAGQFLNYYYEKKIYEFDPFQTVDVKGVGELVKIALERGRATRKDLLVGVCGETGGDPASIDFYNRAGLDYVSCSPFRVPVARLAAAQSEIRVEREKKAAKKPVAKKAAKK
ncbi:MAG: pyruvate, phosphate dikinase [Bacilli bacterium]|jgi:pyruvate,orthophosphate dikinase|nr:pyruvate, phosphate dikinase [Bacilli bacterium]